MALPPRPGAQGAGPQSPDPGRHQDRRQPARTLAPPPRPGALADAFPPLTCRQSEAAALPKMLFFFWIFTCGKPSDTRHVLRLQNITQFQNPRRLDFRAGKRLSAVEVYIISGPLSIRTSPVSDLRLRSSGNSTFRHAKGSHWPCAWPQRLLPPLPASGRSSLSRKQPRKELPYLCLLNEYIQLPYLCLLNEEDFWLSGTGHPGTGPEPAVGARVHFADCPRMAMCMAVCVGSRTHFADCPRMAMCMAVCVGSRTHFADCPRMAVCMAATDTSS